MPDSFINQFSTYVALAGALGFALLALWTLRNRAHAHDRTNMINRGPYESALPMELLQQRGLALAFSMMSAWLFIGQLHNLPSWLLVAMETSRNLVWLAFMYLLLRPENFARQDRAVRYIYASVAGLCVAMLILAGLDGAAIIELTGQAFYDRGLLLSEMIVAISALVLVHNIYTIAAPDARAVLALPMGALAAMWMYDLNLYTISYFAGAPADQLIVLRPAFMALMVPVFASARLQRVNVSIRLSRAATFQSLSLAAIGVYLLSMWLAATLLDMAGKNYGDLAQVAFITAGAGMGAILIISPKIRAWMRVTISKHFFRLRYDYRVEWTRFTDTIGHPGDENNSFHERVIKAVADITESPAGLLLTPDDSGYLMLQARWKWSLVEVPREAASIAASLYLEETGRILIFDEIRDGAAPAEETGICPDWIMQNDRVWLGVPCVHYGRLAGLILLQRPAYARQPDWEDRDLLRVVGRQIASYLSEARGQETLSEVKRFDEFNRRFAFIMHDVKNLVSQLSLVSRNAEKHAGNPEFQADMLHTIQHSVGRMNDLLARLSQHNKGKAEEPRPMEARKVVDAIVREKRLLHPLMTGQENGLMLMADPNRIEQILGHLVQNAIDASAADEPVHIMARDTGHEIAIDVLDRGCGMSPEFVRTQLFRPFTSTKDGGFGIGSYEARQLAVALNGRIEVESVENEGSRFTLYLPKAATSSDKSWSRHRETNMNGQEAA